MRRGEFKILRSGCQAIANRVPVKVINGCPELLLAANYSIVVTLLPKAAASSLAFVDFPRRKALHSLHDLDKSAWFPGHHHQMKVVRHYRVGENVGPTVGSYELNGLQQDPSISAICKYR